ncbi:PREDICTED: uncharacterized protein LOC108550788 [Eufriesea mexicana]|uniref:uncharacterized protein LOC108550788 n=1 Tax=Eufriesea mexicana TaxID=516756 RepID=UPI00083BD36F|nr:PREDICTED: uncharacterized protein LOC108550788 [Eufriesea mexicana]
MNEAQVLKYSGEKNANNLWKLIKKNMAAETEELKARTLNELTYLKMKRDENVDSYINRAEALKNQSQQLGKYIENFEIKMYILRGLRQEFDNNVKILETRRDLEINDIRFALKQEESRREKRKDVSGYREHERVRNARDTVKNDLRCHNCGMEGHTANECYREKRCYNCQNFGHIAANCKVRRNQNYHGRGTRKEFQRGQRGRSTGQNRNRTEVSLRTTDEAVLTARELPIEETTSESSPEDKEETMQTSPIEYKNSNEAVFATAEEEEFIKDTKKARTWLLDTGSTSHMCYERELFDKLTHDEGQVTMVDKKGKKLISEGIGDVVVKQVSSKNNIRLENVLCVPELTTNLLSVAKITDHGYTVKFHKYGAIIYRDPDKIELTAVRVNKYFVRSLLVDNETVAFLSDTDI